MNEGEEALQAEVAHAREELADGDLSHALRHLAVALSLDPMGAEALQLLDRVLDAAGDQAFELLPIEEGTFFGIAALRAYAMARRGRLMEALLILFDVAAFRPEIPYLGWNRTWFAERAPESCDEGADPDDIGAGAVTLVDMLRDEQLGSEGLRRNLEGTLFAVEALRQLHPRAERLNYAAMLLLRRLGRAAEAVAIGRHWFDTSPSWISAVSLANASRDAGEVDEAVANYRRALSLQPDNVSPLLDIGDLLLEMGRYADAAAAYGAVLARSPGDAWAEPSHAFASYLGTKQESYRTKLNSLARTATSSRAMELVSRLKARQA